MYRCQITNFIEQAVGLHQTSRTTPLQKVRAQVSSIKIKPINNDNALDLTLHNDYASVVGSALTGIIQ